MEVVDNQTSHAIELAPGVRCLPVIHGSLEFTVKVREAFLANPPAMLAVELPENFSRHVEDALPHADSIPIITMRLKENQKELHFLMEPLEPIVEAIRSASEFAIPCSCIDLYNTRLLTWLPESFPDTYALQVIGVPALYDLYKQVKDKEKEDEDDFDPLMALVEQVDYYREIQMSSRIRNLMHMNHFDDQERGLLIVCGFKHLDGIKKFINMPEDTFQEHLAQLDLFLSTLGRDDDSFQTDSDDEPMDILLKANERIGLSESGSDEEVEYEISRLARSSSEVLTQPGYYNTTWLIARRNRRALSTFNRIVLQRFAYREAVGMYERESGELFPPQREKLFFRFTRNWSILEKRLLPDSYKLVMAARGFGNDNFARIMYEVLHFLQEGNSSLPEKTLTLDDLYKDSRLIRFRLKSKRKRKVPPPNLVRRFKREKFPGEWNVATEGSGICSYPPEDIIIEDFGTTLQDRARSVIHGAEEKTLPFSSSLLDGIDYRETIRNLHLGKIYVKDIHNRGIDAGSVVIIFSDDDMEHHWKAVWWGEHSQESDMAFYSTPPGEHVVGPGIFRCQYGGLMLTYPPGRLHDIWEDEVYQQFEKPSEMLLAAAIEYNEKNAVVYLAARPPSPRLQSLAGRLGQRIVHISLTSISPVILGRVRRFHVLDSKDRRKDADDYIW